MSSTPIVFFRAVQLLDEENGGSDIRPNLSTYWSRQLTERAVQVLGDVSRVASSDPDATRLHAKIGQLTLEQPLAGTRMWPDLLRPEGFQGAGGSPVSEVVMARFHTKRHRPIEENTHA